MFCCVVYVTSMSHPVLIRWYRPLFPVACQPVINCSVLDAWCSEALKLVRYVTWIYVSPNVISYPLQFPSSDCKTSCELMMNSVHGSGHQKHPLRFGHLHRWLHFHHLQLLPMGKLNWPVSLATKHPIVWGIQIGVPHSIDWCTKCDTWHPSELPTGDCKPGN